MINKNFRMAAAITVLGLTVSSVTPVLAVENTADAVIESEEINAQSEESTGAQADNKSSAQAEDKAEDKKPSDSAADASDKTGSKSDDSTSDKTVEKAEEKTEENKEDKAEDKNAETTGTGADNKDVAVSEYEDKGVISEKDKPYLALGANLSEEQKAKVLSLMGFDPASLDNYDVIYVSNDEEHQYLGEYIPASQIGTRSLSSVVITEAKKGDGLSISTYNINYCTVGMYKNALATAGISDANIIVAGPTSISGTAALVGIFKAYEEMTGDKIDEEIVDAAMDELVTTGELNESIDGDPETIEAMIAELKQQIANGALDNEDDIRAAIKEAAKKYELNLSDENIEKILALLTKLKDLDLDWDTIADRASEIADKLGIDIKSQSFWDSVIAFFEKLIDAIAEIFA